MALNCGIAYYPLVDHMATKDLQDLLSRNGYSLLGDYSARRFLYFSSNACRFGIDITDVNLQLEEEERRELVPRCSRICLVIHFDRICFAQLILLVKLLMRCHGGTVLEGLGSQTASYDIDNIADLPKHPVWRDDIDSGFGSE